MTRCPNCAAELERATPYCPSCGTSLREGMAGDATLLAGDVSSAASSSSERSMATSAAWLASDSGADAPGFAPGTLLGGRFRIIGRLGRGGMGDVFRADDLVLGQAVALKFLPRDLAAHPDRQARFFAEVRLARQVSHPNVCRVYDVGEIDGQPYMSMELVDGDDLSSLLRRIGRLPEDKALDVGRQLCAGIAAAHERGVVHRDLKPANIILDAQGKVRITDFGLAVIAENGASAAGRAGTPAYMAPEQLERGEASVQSDIYSLGVVLYELFTGHRAFSGSTLLEVRRQHQEAQITSPSTVLEDIDPAIERAILRCLEREPGNRPASALAVAAALPGGDPLAAALAAGELPSPEIVAAAGGLGGLRRPVAWGLVAGIAAGMALLLAFSGQALLVRRVPMEKPAAVLVDRAREVLRETGFDLQREDDGSGFQYNGDYLLWLRGRDRSAARWDDLGRGNPQAIRFWYRQSPRDMVGMDFTDGFGVTLNDPPLLFSGMAAVQLDPAGRLLQLEVVPPQLDSTWAESPAPDWSALFTAAGLDPSGFEPAAVQWTPAVYCDARAAWVGPDAARPGVRLRIEAGAYRGRPNYFHVIGPWSRPVRQQPRPTTTGERAGRALSVFLVFATLVAGVALAHRHAKSGSGDRRGAWRLAVYIFVLSMASWLLTENHTTNPQDEWRMLILSLGLSLFLAGLLWVLYVALEPYVRRRWPDALIGWNRVLGGRLGDPRVGRDILVGMLAGVAFDLVGVLQLFLPRWLGLPPGMPIAVNLEGLRGIGAAVAVLLDAQPNTIFIPMALVLAMVLFRSVLRRPLLANVALVLLVTFMLTVGSDSPATDLPAVAALMSILLFVLLRFGLLAAILGVFFSTLLQSYPASTDLSAWYAKGMIIVVAVTAGLALYAARAATRGEVPERQRASAR